MTALDQRDYATVQLVARFKQMTAAQIHELLFFSLSSHMPCHRTLHRLMTQKYLARIERRTVGGAKGGSGQYVYFLGVAGHHLMREGRYNPARTIDYHALAIVDTYIQLARLEREGKLRIVGYSTEPDCWVNVAGHELKPDMYVELERGRSVVKLWLEADLGSEGQKQIKGKLLRYWRAFDAADSEQWPEWPRILFVCVDDWRANELAWIIRQGKPEQQALFRVTTDKEFAKSFG